MGDIKERTKTLEEILEESGISSNLEEQSKLVLWNDDVNSFEWVIFCLMNILNFSYEDAEKSAWTVHLQGKDIIKTGSKNELLPYKKLLEERQLSISIEE
jgi:ATP-dependent Clp protease adaptor protein ClpS